MLLTIVAFGVSALYTPRAATSYKASLKLAVKPQTGMLSEAYGEYYPYVASEYLNDDIGKVIESGAFLAQLTARAVQEVGRSPSGSLETKKAHRIITIDAISSTADDALLLAKVAAEMLTAPGAPYFENISAQNPQVTVVDPPVITGSTSASRVGLDIAVRTILGLFAGIALTFLLDYMDDTVRSRQDLEEQLGIAVLAEIPR